ncbi:unnamed protein product, partial [Polarella glacialis]
MDIDGVGEDWWRRVLAPALCGPEPPRQAGVLTELLAATAAERPNVTVSGDDPELGSLTLAELRLRSLALAALLRGGETAAANVVAVCLRRSPALVVALVGILEAGFAYVPLEPSHPES